MSWEKERTELSKLAAGFGAMAAVLHLLFGAIVAPIVLVGLSLVAIRGVTASPDVRHDIYLVFSLFSIAVGRVASWAMITLMYACGIVVLGSIMRAFGMDKLERDFQRCRSKSTMLVDAQRSTPESFMRQS